MLFFDFEVYRYDWLVVIIDSTTHVKNVIVNDMTRFKHFYDHHKSAVWVGFNSRSYDQWLARGIVAGFEPQPISDWIINKHKPGYQFSRELSSVHFNTFDVMTVRGQSLKQLEAYMGEDIEETSVDFNTKRKLTDDELQSCIDYCTHDVIETINVFTQRQAEFESQVGLIKEFKLPLRNLSKTKAQLAAIILKAKQPLNDRHDEMDISFPATMRIDRNQDIVDFYRTNRDYEMTKSKFIAGVKHVFAWGGLHGAREHYHGQGLIINMDVGSYYPSIMVEYGYLSRNVRNDARFKAIRKQRLAYKVAHDPREAPYKIVLNSTYGATKDRYNALYDPRQANNVCVAGMMLLLDLIEKLEPYVELIQSNTDGLYVRLIGDFDVVDDICAEWEERTGMRLDFHYYDEMWQKDVNNYILVDRKLGKVKTKGSYVKALTPLDYDLPIVNQAIRDYFVLGNPVKETITECHDLYQFQRVVKLSYKYDGALYRHKHLSNKVYRIFASNSLDDGQLLKTKSSHAERIPYTPDLCFIDNDNVKGKPVPRNLDRGWYERLAQSRVDDFLGTEKEDDLFERM